MLVLSKQSSDVSVIGPETKRQKVLGKLLPILDGLSVKRYANRLDSIFSTSWFPFTGVASRINKLKPDIVHLHWICSGMMSIKEIAKIQAPIVWTLHDMWAFTGGCHYPGICLGYKERCGNCEVLQSNKPNDLSRKVFRQKKKCYDSISRITVVGLSKWIATCARESNLLKSTNVVNLPNVIDAQVFSPMDKSLAREILGLPQQKKLILVGMMDDDPRKGLREFWESLRKCDCSTIELVGLGCSKSHKDENSDVKTHYLGYLHDEISLRIAYCAVDVMVFPSIQENLSNTIMESLSCGIPVVAFNVGGNGDMIEHLKTGYLAQPYDTNDLARGIEWIIDNPDYSILCKTARKKVIDQFDCEVVIPHYIEIYRSLYHEYGS